MTCDIIQVLARESAEYQMIEDYVANTHAATHSSYALEVMEVFTIARCGERKRYKPFSKLDNRMLLWHGSRITNYAGILSQVRPHPLTTPTFYTIYHSGITYSST